MIAVWEIQDATTAARKRLLQAGYLPLPAIGKSQRMRAKKRRLIKPMHHFIAKLSAALPRLQFQPFGHGPVGVPNSVVFIHDCDQIRNSIKGPFPFSFGLSQLSYLLCERLLVLFQFPV